MHEREGGHGILLQVSRAGQMACKKLCVVINCPVACSCKPDTGAAHHESKHAWVQDECSFSLGRHHSTSP